MSPFAEELRRLRVAHGLRQVELAARLGCEQSYLSALENDLKQAPPAQFVHDLGRAVELTGEELDRLERARLRSARRYQVPSAAPQEFYEVAFKLFSKAEELGSRKLNVLSEILDFQDESAPAKEGRIRRKDRGESRGKETA